MKFINLKKLSFSFHHAFRGVIRLLTNEQNARIHAIITICTGMLVYILDVNRLEAAILFMAVIMVFAMEIMNTAIEKVCNEIDQKHNENIKFIKDGMAGAVLLASLIAIVVAGLIFLPHVRILFE